MTATAGSDYTAVSSGTVTFGAGSTASQTLTVTTLGDSPGRGGRDVQAEETFTVTLTGSNLPAGVSLGTATATGTITDDEALTVSVAGPLTVVEGNTATFTVSVAGGTSTAPVVVTYTVGGTATAGGTDYTAPGVMLTLDAGASSGTIAIPTLDDMVLDRGETLSVTLTNASTSAGTVTVGSPAAAPTFKNALIDDRRRGSYGNRLGDGGRRGDRGLGGGVHGGAVGRGVEFGDVELIPSSSTSDVTATAGSTTTRRCRRGTVTFGAGSTASQTLTVTTLGDSLAEAEETFIGDADRLEPAGRGVAGDGDGDRDHHRRRGVDGVGGGAVDGGGG